jgi:hypothetical protein
MTELKRCPFCGGNPRILHDPDGTPAGVVCKCGAIVRFMHVPKYSGDTFGDMRERIVERYNRRGGE